VTTFLFVLLISGLGGFGSVLRMFLARFSGKLPWGILIANTAASVVAGMFWQGQTLQCPMACSWWVLLAGYRLLVHGQHKPAAIGKPANIAKPPITPP